MSGKEKKHKKTKGTDNQQEANIKSGVSKTHSVHTDIGTKKKPKESEKIREEMLRRLDESMDAHLKEEKQTRHIDFIKNKIMAWGERHDKTLSVLVYTQGSNTVLDVKNKKDETVHRFIAGEREDAKEALGGDTPVSFLPNSAKTRDEAFGIEFDISEALCNVFGAGCNGR